MTRPAKKPQKPQTGAPRARRPAAPSPGDTRAAVSGGDSQGDARQLARSEGHRQLRALSHTSGELARLLDCSRQTVAAWRTGQKTPSPESRVAIERAVGVPAASWDRHPVDRPVVVSSSSAAAASSPGDAPPAKAKTTLDDVKQLLRDLEADAANTELPSELARIRDTRVKALSLLARIEERDTLFEASAIARHPSWRRVRTALLDALRPHPDAARAVVSALQEVEA